MGRIILFVVGFVFLILAGASIFQDYAVSNAKPEIVYINRPYGEILEIIKPTGTPASTPIQAETEVVMVLPEPTKVVTVNQFVLGNFVNLSSGLPTALTIHLADDYLISSNWAGAVRYNETDDQNVVFQPYQGVIYSYLGDVLTSWVHSGINKSGQRYFATNLELFIRKASGGFVLSQIEAKTNALSLIGRTAYLCQDDLGAFEPLSDFDNTVPCLGKQVGLEIVAIAIIQHEKVPEYDAVVTGLNGWLIDNYPEAGFDQLDADNGWLIRTCVGIFADQKSDGTPGYEYNRAVVGFRVLDGE